MRLLFITVMACVLSNVCLGQGSALGRADSYWPSWVLDDEREQKRKYPAEFEDVMLEGLRVNEHIENLQWEEADKYCRETLRLYFDHMFLGHLEQEIAFRMLHKYLLTESLNDKQRDAIGFYLDLLLQNNTPDTYTVYRSLQALQTRWSANRIKEAANQTYQSGEKWLALPSAQIELEEGMPRSIDVGTTRIWNMHQSLPKLRAFIDQR